MEPSIYNLRESLLRLHGIWVWNFGLVPMSHRFNILVLWPCGIRHSFFGRFLVEAMFFSLVNFKLLTLICFNLFHQL